MKEREGLQETARKTSPGRISRLIGERRRMMCEGVRGQEISTISRQIQQVIRKKMKKERQQEIRRSLEEIQGLKHIPRIRSGGRKTGIAKMNN